MFALVKRMQSRLAGLSEDAVDDALNTDNPKAALIRLLVERSGGTTP